MDKKIYLAGGCFWGTEHLFSNNYCYRKAGLISNAVCNCYRYEWRRKIDSDENA